MTKKDIGFIKFIKPQLKQRQLDDQVRSYAARLRVIRGETTPSVDIVEAGGLLKTALAWIEEKKRGGKECH